MWIVTLYAPAAVFAICMVVMTAYRGTPGNVLFRIPIPWMGDFQVKVTTKLGLRISLAVVMAFCAVWYIAHDYSSLFPTRLKMEVFFDEAGLLKSLLTLTEEVKEEIGYSEENFALRSLYFSECDAKLEALVNLGPFFMSQSASIHSEGFVEFVVSKTAGFQTYHIDSAPGELRHQLEQAGELPAAFESRFEKLPSSFDYVSPTLSQLFSRGVILQPRFKQILEKPGHREEFDHVLVAVTRVVFFPVPKVYNTIFFMELQDGMGVTPISYTAYKY